jgi:hypothetical protein
MKKVSYAGYRFPPEIVHQAIWLYLWTVPAMQGLSSAIWPTLGCSYLFGLWRNVVADLDEIRGLAPNYLGGLWSPIEPAGLASSGPTGLPSCVRLPSHSRNLLTPSCQAALR